MRYKKVLLCMPPLEDRFRLSPYPQPGSGYLSEYLSKHSVEHEVIDMRLGYKLQDLKNKIKQFKPDLIGFSILVSYRYDIPYALIKAIKSKNYDIILGGSHPSVIGKKILEETDADYALKYEGEEALVDLCKGKPLNQIFGLIYRKNNKIIENPYGYSEINKLPFPKYKKFELNKYSRKRINLVTSRGCPYNCIYCAVKKVMGKKVRLRSTESVLQELKYWHSLGYKEFNIIDDNFTFNRQRTLDICKGIEKAGLKDLYLICGNGVRADRVDREILTEMKKAGFKEFRMGVEVGNDRMLKVIRKGETRAQIEKAIELCCEMGFDVGLNFLIGFPTETEDDVKDSFKLALKYPVDATGFHGPIPFPGTELYSYLKKNNIPMIKDYLRIVELGNNKPIFETPELSIKKREELFKQARKVEKRIVKNLFLRRTEKLGFFSPFLVNLILFSPFYSTLVKLCSRFKWFKKITIHITNKFDLRNVGNLCRKEMAEIKNKDI